METQNITITQLRRSTGKYVREAGDGKRILVHRHGKPLFFLLPLEFLEALKREFGLVTAGQSTKRS